MGPLGAGADGPLGPPVVGPDTRPPDGPAGPPVVGPLGRTVSAGLAGAGALGPAGSPVVGPAGRGELGPAGPGCGTPGPGVGSTGGLAPWHPFSPGRSVGTPSAAWSHGSPSSSTVRKTSGTDVSMKTQSGFESLANATRKTAEIPKTAKAIFSKNGPRGDLIIERLGRVKDSPSQRRGPGSNSSRQPSSDPVLLGLRLPRRLLAQTPLPCPMRSHHESWLARHFFEVTDRDFELVTARAAVIDPPKTARDPHHDPTDRPTR